MFIYISFSKILKICIHLFVFSSFFLPERFIYYKSINYFTKVSRFTNYEYSLKPVIISSDANPKYGFTGPYCAESSRRNSVAKCSTFLVVVVLRSPIHANEPSEYNGMLYRTSNRVLNNGIKVIILICMDGTSQYHHHHFFW